MEIIRGGLLQVLETDSIPSQIIVDCKSVPYWLQSEGDNVLGSVHPSVCPPAKSNRSHYQSKVFVCVSAISWCVRIIVQIGFWFFLVVCLIHGWINIMKFLWAICKCRSVGQQTDRQRHLQYLPRSLRHQRWKIICDGPQDFESKGQKM